MASALCQVDNSKCDKDIKCITFKLRRLVYANTNNNSEKFENSCTLLKNEYPGVAAGKTGLIQL